MTDELSTVSEPSDVITAFFGPEWTDLEPSFGELRRHLLSPWFPAVRVRGGRSSFLPSADVADLGDAYEIRLDLPGFSKDQIDARVHGNVVHVTATDLSETEGPKTGTYLRRERVGRSFERIFELPERVVSDQVSARYQDGVLSLTVPKAHPVVEQKVKID